jgi:hypothetical protein
VSPGDTNAPLVNLLFLLVLFLVKIWLLNACLLLSLPDPVKLNLFLALEFVLIFGIVLIYFGTQRYIFSVFIKRISKMPQFVNLSFWWITFVKVNSEK